MTDVNDDIKTALFIEDLVEVAGERRKLQAQADELSDRIKPVLEAASQMIEDINDAIDFISDSARRTLGDKDFDTEELADAINYLKDVTSE